MNGLTVLGNTPHNFRAGKIADCVEIWESLTTDKWILNVVRGDFIEFESVPLQIHVPGEVHLSAGEKKALHDSLTEFESLQIIEECQANERDGFYCNLFPRIKRDQSTRVIFNLKQLNRNVEYVHFKMDTIKDAIRLIKKNCLFASIDFKHAYFSVRISPEHRHFFRFHWKGRHYQFTCLPQGFSPAPRIFTKLMKPAYSHLREHGAVIVSYIDDSLLFFYDREEGTHEVNKVMQFFDKLGLTIHPGKSVIVPAHAIEYLGFTLNSVDMTVELTDRKKDKIAALARSLLQRKMVTIHELAQFIGNLVAAAPGVAYAALHYKPLEIARNAALTGARGEAQMTLDEIMKDEIRWWSLNIGAAVRLIEVPDIDITLHADASNIGWGGVSNDVTTGGHWSASEANQHINWKELKAAHLTLQSLCLGVTNKHVHLRLDNTTAVACIQRQGSTKEKLMTLTQSIFAWALEREIHLSASHIPGVINESADRESRKKNKDCEWMLNGGVFSSLCKTFGKPSMDMFASRLNNQLPKYVAWRPDPTACHVDAFTMSWCNTYSYAFPPFSVMGQVLQKLELEKGKMLVVAPLWTTQAWWSRALTMLVDNPVILPRDCLQMPQEPSLRHPLRDKLRLVAMKLSGNPSETKAFRTRLQSFCSTPGEQAHRDNIGHITSSGVLFVSQGKLIHCCHL